STISATSKLQPATAEPSKKTTEEALGTAHRSGFHVRMETSVSVSLIGEFGYSVLRFWPAWPDLVISMTVKSCVDMFFSLRLPTREAGGGLNVSKEAGAVSPVLRSL